MIIKLKGKGVEESNHLKNLQYNNYLKIKWNNAKLELLEFHALLLA
jgi:hypothetical protein